MSLYEAKGNKAQSIPRKKNRLNINQRVSLVHAGPAPDLLFGQGGHLIQEAPVRQVCSNCGSTLADYGLGIRGMISQVHGMGVDIDAMISQVLWMGHATHHFGFCGRSVPELPLQLMAAGMQEI